MELRDGRTDRAERRAACAQPNAKRAPPASPHLGRRAADHHRHDLEAGRMSVLAAIRPDSWNFPLFLHVFGAMILVGGLLSCAGDPRLRERRREDAPARILVAPGRLAAGLGADANRRRVDLLEGGLGRASAGSRRSRLAPTGAFIADIGGLILFVALVVGGVGVYRLREGKGAEPAEGDTRALGCPPGRLPGRRLGNGGQAELAQRRRESPRGRAHQPDAFCSLPRNPLRGDAPLASPGTRARRGHHEKAARADARAGCGPRRHRCSLGGHREVR